MAAHAARRVRRRLCRLGRADASSAAGEAKSQVVADAIQEPAHVKYPCSALHGHAGAVFYLTRGAAKKLEERQITDLHHYDITTEVTESVLVALATTVFGTSAAIRFWNICGGRWSVTSAGWTAVRVRCLAVGAGI